MSFGKLATPAYAPPVDRIYRPDEQARKRRGSVIFGCLQQTSLNIMTYEICFIRSRFEDQQAAKTRRHSAGRQCEELIVQQLHDAGIKNLPALSEWSFPLVDGGLKRYEITARFTTILPCTDVEELFRAALARGLGGDFRIRELPAVFRRMASRN
jgi:hypothetical protein